MYFNTVHIRKSQSNGNMGTNIFFGRFREVLRTKEKHENCKRPGGTCFLCCASEPN